MPENLILPGDLIAMPQILHSSAFRGRKIRWLVVYGCVPWRRGSSALMLGLLWNGDRQLHIPGPVSSKIGRMFSLPGITPEIAAFPTRSKCMSNGIPDFKGSPVTPSFLLWAWALGFCWQFVTLVFPPNLTFPSPRQTRKLRFCEEKGFHCLFLFFPLSHHANYIVICFNKWLQTGWDFISPSPLIQGSRRQRCST